MMEKLEHAQLQKITLHNNSVQWYKKNKEIVVNSVLFDVHRYFVVKDSTVFTGLFDTKETELKKQVRKLFDQREENNASRELVIAKLILQLWTINDDGEDMKLLRSSYINRKYAVSFCNLISADISIPFPPPRT